MADANPDAESETRSEETETEVETDAVLDLEVPESLAPAEAFALLGNETRIAILQELWRAPEEPVAFSELRRRVGVEDSAQFNYHLGKLTGHFVARTEDGYRFRYAGEKVVRAILAGTFTERLDLTFAVEGTCHDCGAGLRARYEDERLGIECPACGAEYGRYAFPPGGLRDRTPEEVAAAFNQRVRHLHCLAADGVCPECGGVVTTTVVADEAGVTGQSVRVDHECERCHHRIRSPVGVSLLDDGTVLAFHEEHGVDLPAVPYWTLAWCVTDESLTVESRDPWRVSLDIPLGGELLRVTVDGDLRVIRTARTLEA